MEQLLKIAFGELGTEEIAGNENNPEVLKYASEPGIKGITNDEIPWCSTFVNRVAWKAGLQISGKANARSWLNVGTKVTSPEPGDVVVFWRESPSLSCPIQDPRGILFHCSLLLQHVDPSDQCVLHSHLLNILSAISLCVLIECPTDGLFGHHYLSRHSCSWDAIPRN